MRLPATQFSIREEARVGEPGAVLGTPIEYRLDDGIMAAKIAKMGPIAVRDCKILVNEGLEKNMDDANRV